MLVDSPEWRIWIVDLCENITRPLGKRVLLPCSQLIEQLTCLLLKSFVAVKITKDVIAKLQN